MVLYSCCQCLRFARIVRFQSISAWRGRRLRTARFSAPLTAVRMGSSSCFMSASTTLRTTRRAVSLVFSGMMPRSDMSVDTRFTSGCTLSSISGWSSILCRLRRSKASFCMTCTTEDGKKRRMSPSQRATRGDEAPLPPRRLCLLSASYSAASASSICRSSGLSPARPQLA